MSSLSQKYSHTIVVWFANVLQQKLLVKVLFWEPCQCLKMSRFCYCSEYKEACCCGGMHSLFACIIVVRKRCRICRTMKIIRNFFERNHQQILFESKKFGLVGKIDGFVSKTSSLLGKLIWALVLYKLKRCSEKASMELDQGGAIAGDKPTRPQLEALSYLGIFRAFLCNCISSVYIAPIPNQFA